MHGVVQTLLVSLDGLGMGRERVDDLIKKAVALVISEDVLDAWRLGPLPLRLDAPQLHWRLHCLIIAAHKLVGPPQSFKATLVILRLAAFISIFEFSYCLAQQVQVELIILRLCACLSFNEHIFDDSCAFEGQCNGLLVLFPPAFEEAFEALQLPPLLLFIIMLRMSVAARVMHDGMLSLLYFWFFLGVSHILMTDLEMIIGLMVGVG